MIVELTLVCGLVLLIISSSVSVSMLLRKKIKHGFMETLPLAPLTQNDLPKVFQEDLQAVKNSISKSGIYFDYKKWPDIVEKLSEEGWSEQGKLRKNASQIHFFRRGPENMEIVDTKEGKVEVTN